MKIIIHEKDGQKISEVLAENIVLNTTQDALDLLTRKEIATPKKIILHKENINPDFFELRTGFAGEVLQKYSTYGVHLAIIGDFSVIKSDAFQALIRECNRGAQTFFVDNLKRAIEKLGAF